MAVRKAAPEAPATGEAEWDLSAEGVSVLKVVVREGERRWKVPGSSQIVRCCSERGREARQGTSVVRSLRRSTGRQRPWSLHSGKPNTPTGEVTMVTADDAAFTVSSPGAGDAACGEPARLWTGPGRRPHVGVGSKARDGKEASDRREPEARELKRLAGACDNKSIAEIGERHLLRVTLPAGRHLSGWRLRRSQTRGSWFRRPDHLGKGR